MYKADGFDLSKSSYDLLVELAALPEGERMTFSNDGRRDDLSVVRCLDGLGLVDHTPWADGQAEYWATRLGRDFVEDYAEEERLREEERRRRERFEWRISVCSSLLGVLGTVLGFVLSAVWSVATGQVALVGW